MQLATAILAYGTSQGAEKAWDTRGRGRKPRPHVEKLDRSKLSKKFSVPVNTEKIRAAAESVKTLASVLGGVVTTNSHPWDILLNGSKVGIEVKRFMPGHKHLKATVHPESREKKVAFADKTKMKRMYLVVHDASNPSKESWFVRRVGDKGDPRSDPKDPRTGWSYNTRKMYSANAPEGLKGMIK